MGRYPSPLVKHDLSRLEDAEGRDIALTSLKSCVKQLEPESIAFFLDQIAEAHQDASRPYVISLYEDVARAHRALLVPYIPRIMEALTSALAESGSALHVHEACAKVVAAISLYCIDMEMLSHQAKDVLGLLSEPLLCILVSKFEPLAAGSAVCLQALVKSKNWEQAPWELVSEVCSRVTAAVGGKSCRTLAHIQLVCAVAKVNREALGRYGRELLNSGKDIIQSSSSWTLRVGAAQLLNAVMGIVDSAALDLEIGSAVEVLDKYRLDRMPKVRLAVAEALKTARGSCNMGEKATAAKTLSSRGGDRKKSIRSRQSDVYNRPTSSRQARTAPSIRFSGRSPAKDKSSETEVMAFDFVVVDPAYGEDFSSRNQHKEQRGGNRAGRSRAKTGSVRHTVSVEPGGFVIQEWIKLGDGFPLSGIDESPEYAHVEEALYGQQFCSSLGVEREKSTPRLIEELDPTPLREVQLEETEPAACDTTSSKAETRGAEDAAEWSVRDNPIAKNSESLAQTLVDYTEKSSQLEAEGHCAKQEAEAQDEVQPQCDDRVEATSSPSPQHASPRSSAAVLEVQQASTTDLHDASENSCSRKETDEDEQHKEQSRQQQEQHRVDFQGNEDCKIQDVITAALALEGKGDDTVLVEETSVGQQQQQRQQWSYAGLVRKGWSGLQCGVEGILGVSACAMVALPAAMAFIKCLEPSSSDSSLSSYYYYSQGSNVPT